MADCLESLTLMTHFADADEPRGIEQQLGRFRAMTGGRALPVSLANSAALLRFPDAVGDWVRPGIMLYGSSPFPAMRKARSSSACAGDDAGKRTDRGARTGARRHRGLRQQLRRRAPMRVGIVACGYADGYPRHAPTGTPVRIAGRRTRTLGRVSMDKICIDLE
jgi:alanine racemase